MHFISCTNTHRDVTDLVNHGMVKNAKWHILRSYRFVAEVTFNKIDFVSDIFTSKAILTNITLRNNQTK